MQDACRELVARASTVSTDAERWALIAEGWRIYEEAGASAFDWDYESRDLMRALLDHEG
jgi:hypothetical protein